MRDQSVWEESINDLGVELSKCAANDNAWHEESTWHPAPVGGDEEEVPDKEEKDNISEVCLKIVVHNRLDGATLSVKEKSGKWTVLIVWARQVVVGSQIICFCLTMWC